MLNGWLVIRTCRSVLVVKAAEPSSGRGRRNVLKIATMTAVLGVFAGCSPISLLNLAVSAPAITLNAISLMAQTRDNDWTSIFPIIRCRTRHYFCSFMADRGRAAAKAIISL